MLTANEKVLLRVSSAVLTLNRRELEWAMSQPTELIGDDLAREVQSALRDAPVPGESRLVRTTTYLPTRLQYIGQRAILLFPALARRILRGTGLHHQMY